MKKNTRKGPSVVSVLVALSLSWTGSALADGDGDTMRLTDDPGNWFRSDATGTPVTVISAGQRVDFDINGCCTNTRHTATLLIKPVGSRTTLDQDDSEHGGGLSASFDVPGVYVVICKIHPYMVGVVAVRDAKGNVPDVQAAALPFIGHLGVSSLPAATVLSVLLSVAPDDATKAAKWDIRGASARLVPAVPGVGEVWLDTQFERVPKQTDESGVAKPGTITVIDAGSFTIKREVNGLGAHGLWNNPHNIWANFALDTIYSTNWFGQWLNRIDRVTGRITSSVTVGDAPTHAITIPVPGSPQFGFITVPLSAEQEMVKVQDTPKELKVVDSVPTGNGRNHPHGHWLTCGRGDRIVVANTFKGLGVAGSISIMDTVSGRVIKEFLHDANDPLRSALLFPIATGACHVKGVQKAYVANAVSGFVTVVDVDNLTLLKNIPVTLTPDNKTGQDLLNTLQVPIQTPVSANERWAATAVLSLTNVKGQRASPDHVAIIDTTLDEVVAILPTPGGTHGVNWGAKKGGGYYAYVSNQWSNVMTIIDPDPNNDDDGHDAAVVGTIVLSNNSPGAGVTDGTGGQGVKPLPLVHDGWIQQTVALAAANRTSAEVRGWINDLTAEQKNPVSGTGHAAHTSPAPTQR